MHEQLQYRKTLEEHLSCFICLQGINQAKILPCCGKCVCHGCITAWIKKNSSAYQKTCPHCRQAINQSEIRSCPLIDQLKEQFEKIALNSIGIPNQEPTKCEKHGDTLKYYCLDCDEGCCSDGIVLHKAHQGHSLENMGDIRRTFSSGANELKSVLESFHIELKRSASSVLAENKSKYIDVINRFVSEVESRMNQNFKEAEVQYEQIASKKRKRVRELDAELQDMSQFYERSLSEGKHAVKGRSWLAEMKGHAETVQEEFNKEISAIEIKDEITPPSVNVDVKKSDLPMEIKVFGQVVKIYEMDEGAAYGIESSWKFMISAMGDGKLFFKCAGTAFKAQLPSEFTLTIQPQTYKDAYEALAASLA